MAKLDEEIRNWVMATLTRQTACKKSVTDVICATILVKRRPWPPPGDLDKEACH
jgi:hypothetical protein